jgi:hypothetical protein
MIIGQANSIRFKKVDSNLPNFDNTLLADELFYNDKIETYCQRWKNTDTEKVIIKSDSAVVPTVIATKSDKTTVTITAVEISSYDQDNDSTDDLFFFSFDVVFSLYTLETFITVTQGAVVYKSEPFKGDANIVKELADKEILKVEYYNEDNAFQLDFSTGITFTLYIAAINKDYEFGGENSIYDNQSELEKTKETVQRLFTLRTLHIPRYLGETLKLASSMDNFVVNDVSFVRVEQPEMTPLEGSNLVDFSMILTDKEYLGVNSHDIGFDCDVSPTDSEIMIKSEDNASGSVTFSIPTGYLVHTLRAQWVSGATVEVKLGTSIGGSQLVFPRDLSSVDTDRTTSIHGDIDRDSDTDIYATVTGGVANLDLQIIKNIQ